MYRAAGYLTQCVEVRSGGEVIAPPYQHIHFDDQPSGPLTVWRGAEARTEGKGMSWTFYADCAEQFAVANLVHEDDQPAVFRATIPGRAVLAVFCDEREQEVVVNLHMLRGRATPEAVADAALEACVMEAVADRQRGRARLERLFGAN